MDEEGILKAWKKKILTKIHTNKDQKIIFDIFLIKNNQGNVQKFLFP
jgi:hypothetical protein